MKSCWHAAEIESSDVPVQFKRNSRASCSRHVLESCSRTVSNRSDGKRGAEAVAGRRRCDHDLNLFPTDSTRALPFYPTFFRADEFVHTVGDCAMLALYPPFLAAALGTKLTRPFSDTRIQFLLRAAALVLCGVVLWGPIKLGGTLLLVSELGNWIGLLASVLLVSFLVP